MPGLAQRDEQISNASSLGFWSKNSSHVSYNQLRKFWSELSPQVRQDLLKIDKQTLFEQARKNMYCSRCNGLLLEGFMQIVMYGKSLQQEGAVSHLPTNGKGASKNQNGRGSVVTNDEIHDPLVHPWGGLTTARDGSLTLLDCYLYSKSLKELKNVFDSARDREHEREKLYPDACGGGGRGWISQGMASSGRGHGTRETCALHTARLSCDTLVDFWSALGEETRQSLLRMKEEDFIERLMYRFDSKRFCRDCRRNVIREFKELKRLKKEPRCTSWFCVSNTDIQFEVTHNSVKADWRQKFAEEIGSYHHFEWALGSGEGKSDILEFENVGMNGSVHVNDLNLRGLSACYITLRALKLDGRCSEFSFKAHALKGQQCVHSRLVAGDGFFTITRGESIGRFFEHAEEAEEEEDDDSMDKDGNELDGECSRPQKHAKSPELAREFLLDASTVIFKEQVEKAFREGTARQNAHSIFVCLALNMLEERVHVACKEIITLEKQVKLLEEEEKEKREEEEKKEKKRAKEKEKKLRRKERSKGKETECPESNHFSDPLEVSKDESLPSIDEEQNSSLGCRDSASETGDNTLSRPGSPDNHDEQLTNDFDASSMADGLDGEAANNKDDIISFIVEQSKFTRRTLKFVRRRNAVVAEGGSLVNGSHSRGIDGSNRQLRVNAPKSNGRNSGVRQCSSCISTESYEFHSCSCNQGHTCREKVDPHPTVLRVSRDFKSVCKSESDVETPKPFYRERHKSKNLMGNNPCGRDSVPPKKVWEPKRSDSDSDITLSSPTFSIEGAGADNDLNKSSADGCSSESSGSLDEIDHGDDNLKKQRELCYPKNEDCSNGEGKDDNFSTDPITSSSSNSDNCSSCLSEGDSTTPSSNHGNLESSSTSDSEDTSQHSEKTDSSVCIQDGFSESPHDGAEKKQILIEMVPLENRVSVGLQQDITANKVQTPPVKASQISENGIPTVNTASQHQGMFSPIQNQNIQFPVYQAPSSMGYYHQTPVSWPSAPANGVMPFTHSNPYLYASPLGYGVNRDSRLCMQYGAPQHLATPVFNPSPVPLYHQPLAKDNGFNKEEQINVPFWKPTAGRQETFTDFHAENLIAGGHGGQLADKSAKPNIDTNGFSLFHSGGPVGCKSDLMPLKDWFVDCFSSQFSADHPENGGACDKKENPIKEYNLFATSNRIKFLSSSILPKEL